VSDKLVIGLSACFFKLEDQVHNQRKQEVESSRKSNVINVSEKCDIVVVVLVLCRCVVVQVLRNAYLPLFGVDGDILVLGFSETSQHES
jgi:hypothetical protein